MIIFTHRRINMKIVSAAVAMACLLVATGASAERLGKVAVKHSTAHKLSVIPDIRHPGGHTS
jgi:hypothetical protein